MGQAEVDHAVQWLATNREWSVYISERGSDAVGEAFAGLTPAERHTVWVHVRQQLGLAADAADSSVHHGRPESTWAQNNTPMMPGEGALPRADGTEGITGGGVDGTFGRDGVHVTGANVAGVGNDTVDVPSGRSAYTNPTSESQPPNPLDGPLGGPSQAELDVQWQTLQAFEHAVTALGQATGGQATDIHPAIQLCLTAAHDVLVAGHAHDAAVAMATAMHEWDICFDPNAGTHQDWAIAAGSVHNVAQDAYTAWDNWFSATNQLIGADDSMTWYGTQLGEAADHARAAIGSPAQL